MKAVENIIKFCEENVNQDFNSHRGAYFNVIKFCKEQAKEMESQEQGYSEEEVLKAQQAILCNTKDALMNENYIIEYLNNLKTNNMKQTAVEWLAEQLFGSLGIELTEHQSKMANEIFFKQAKEMENRQQCYSEEEVLPLLEILEKCKEYFLLKTDAKSEERADAIGQAIEDFKKLKNK